MANSTRLLPVSFRKNDEPSLPTSKQHSMPSARESSPTGPCPQRPSRSSPSQSRTSRNARTASRGIPRRRCATVQRQRSSWKQFGSPPRCGLGAPTLIRPFRSWQWTKLLIEPRAADGHRLRPPTGGHDCIGNKAAFARAAETGLCAAVSRRWCPRPRRSPLATRPTQVESSH